MFSISFRTRGMVYLKSFSQDQELIAALVNVTNHLFMASDSGLLFVLIHLDFSTTDHNILLQTL